MTVKQRRNKAERIRQLWRSGVRNKTEIAREVGCNKSNVWQVIARMEAAGTVPDRPKPARAATCQRPDVGNGLKPCGRPLHEIGGEKLGVCKHHWDTGKPVPGQRNTRIY